ncbi:MAG: hybrid sensor histidine kinase/response regulator [Nitrospinae bacterium]|nr:hybrid sensor histidine kinase/response regulator [Nitrospinota bacterium]
MIEDEELRVLFKTESEEHLQRLDEGLLRLEANPNDRVTLEDVFREAHSLKGASKMLGVTDVEIIAHRFEDMLGSAKRGETVLSPKIIDYLYQKLDEIRKLVCQAVTGEPSDVSVSSILAAFPVDAPATEPEETGETAHGDAEIDDSIPLRTPSPSSSTQPMPDLGNSANRDLPSAIGPFQSQPSNFPPSPIGPRGSPIETIRVAPQKLDGLITQAGELTVTKTRIVRRLIGIEEAVGLWEEWNRDAFAHRSLLSEIGTERNRIFERGARNHDDGRKLIHFHERERERLERLGILLNRMKIEASEDNARLQFIVSELEEGIRAVRLLPLSTIFNLFPRMVRDISRDQSKEIQLLIEGGETTADKRILEEIKDPLMHMIRNAIDHGIESPEERKRSGKSRSGTIRLRAYQTATNIVIELMDDGRGLDIETIKRTAVKREIYPEEKVAAMTPAQIQSLIFAYGFSTSSFVTDVSGRGVGLDVVRANVERLKGTIQLESAFRAGCIFRVQLPITLTTARVLIAAVKGQNYALPVEFVQTSRWVSPQDIFSVEGRQTIALDGRPVSVARLSDLLELRAIHSMAPSKEEKVSETEKELPCIVLSIGEERLGLLVDSLLEEQEVLLKSLGGMLKRVRNVSGATILATGEICMILNPQDLLKTIRKRVASVSPEKPAEEVERKKHILLVDDSITTRTQEKRILESAGYEVIIAIDGVDAFNKLSIRSFDAVVSDIQMPNMDGLTLTEKIRRDKRYKELPIILVTTLSSEEDKKRGIEVGANAYITKPTFEQKVLLDTLRRLV